MSQGKFESNKIFVFKQEKNSENFVTNNKEISEIDIWEQEIEKFTEMSYEAVSNEIVEIIAIDEPESTL